MRWTQTKTHYKKRGGERKKFTSQIDGSEVVVRVHRSKRFCSKVKKICIKCLKNEQRPSSTYCEGCCS